MEPMGRGSGLRRAWWRLLLTPWPQTASRFGLVARARTQLREVEGVVLFIEVETACVRGSTNQIQVV